MWDKPPPGLEGLNVAQIAALQPSTLVPLIPALSSQQTRQARRIYVGGIPATVSEAELREFFDSTMLSIMLSSGMLPSPAGNPVMAVQINHEKMFGFVEFRAPEEATAAMGLDGILLHGNPIKVCLYLLFSILSYSQ